MLETKSKKVKANFAPLTVVSIDSSRNNGLSRLLLKQEVTRTVEGVKVGVATNTKFTSKPYVDVRTKAVIMKNEEVEKQELQAGMELTNAFIKRTISDKPIWDGQKKASNGYYTGTILAPIDDIEDCDNGMIITERDVYIKQGEKIVNIRKKEEVVKNAPKTKLLVV